MPNKKIIIKVGKKVTVSVGKGTVSRMNDDGTFSVRYMTDDGARFLHRLTISDLRD